MSKRENWLNILRQRDRDREKKARMAEMDEMDKAFEDFSKKCEAAMKACQDFIEMDINKTPEPTLERLEVPKASSQDSVTRGPSLPKVTIVHADKING